MVTKTIYLIGDSLDDPPFYWVVPNDFNPDDNTIEAIGGGGAGAPNGGGGGAGGAYAKITNFGGVPGQAVSYQLKSTANGSYSNTQDYDTWFNDTSTLVAKAGPSASSATGATAPSAASSVGDVTHKGGDGGDGQGSLNPTFVYASGGGGSAATSSADGYDGGNAEAGSPIGYGGGGGGGTGAIGSDGSNDDGGDGGQSADGVAGGTGGNYVPGGTDEERSGSAGSLGSGGGAGSENHSGANGGAGVADPNGSSPFGFGGGGGGTGSNTTFAPISAGDGGDFGGGGGGSSTTTGGSGSRGIIKITYTATAGYADNGSEVAPTLKAADNVQPFHLFEFDAGIVGSETPITPTLEYTYGFGSAPFDAISLESIQTISRRTFTFSDKPYVAPTSDPDGPKVSRARMESVPSINRVINLSPFETAAAFSWGGGKIDRQDDDFIPSGSTFQGINYYSADGAPARVYLGLKTWDASRGIYTDPNIADLLTIFEGVAQQWKIGRQFISVPVRDLLYLLSGPLSARSYSGDGGYGGDASIAGLPYPKARGGTASYPIKNVKPVLIDATNRIYQYNDAAGTVEALYEGAYSGGITFESDTTDLYTGSTTNGYYRTDNSRGLFQLGSEPTGEITCDVTGEFPRGGAISNPSKIARYLITEDMGISSDYLDIVEFTLAEVNNDYVAGAYFDPQQNWSGVNAVGFMLGSFGARIGTSRIGLFRPYVVQAAGLQADDVYGAEDIIAISDIDVPGEVSPACSRLRVRYQKNWTVQSSGYIASASAAQKQFAASAGKAATWADSDNALRYPNAKDPNVIETALLKESDAQTVANKAGLLWGSPRKALRLDLPLYALARDIGDVVRIEHDIGIRPYPMYALVYGVSYTPGNPYCSLMVLV